MLEKQRGDIDFALEMEKISTGQAIRSYEELLKVLYQLAQISRRDGLVTLEKHVEQPTQSNVLQKAPTLLAIQ